MRDFITIYLFDDEVYYTLEEAQEVVAEKVYELYPEIIHSDFDAFESTYYEDLCEEIEEIDLSIERLKENIGGDDYERKIGDA